MLKIFCIITGGGIGAISRYGLFLLVQRLTGPQFPSGTLAVNLLGSLLTGFLWSLLMETHISPEWRLFIFTGLLGGFTTFSTFTLESTQLVEAGKWDIAVIYMAASNIIGLLLVFLGYFLAQKFLLLQAR